MGGYTNFPNGVASMGVPLTGERMITGSVFFVDSNTGSNGNKGTNKNKPFATIDYAIGRCTANKGDTIYVMPNHYESGSAADLFDADVAGINIIGLGHGSNQPQIDFLHADTTCAIGADDVLIENINFHSNITGVAIGLDIEAGADNAIVRNCKFDVETTATDEFLISINVGVVSNPTIEGCMIDNGLGGAAVGIKFVGATTKGTVQNNLIAGDYSTANINGITTLSTELMIRNNVLINGGSGNIGTEPVIEMLTGTTGYVIDNHFFCNVATIAAQTVADTMFFSNNFAGEDVGAAAGNILRTDAASVTASADD